ncbi:uncharacterized protein LOC134183455 [Corticium candelabrum]|uniref:uncharacterized protein LOC134183455 n=1 Tax=Corticium candelabrum TaxID=121492 RepID=UPI002E25F4F0|nr:uncharacterized protein LOC134183455 [Corticium candelabrum]
MAGVTTVAITSCDSAEFRSAPTQMQKIEPTKPGIEFGHYHRIGEQAMPSLLSQTVEMMDDCDGGTTHRVQQLRSLVAGPIEQSQLLSKEDAGRSSLNAGKHSNVSVHRFRNYYFETSRERQMSMNSHPGENAMEEVNSEHVPMEILQEVKLPSECITATHEEQERGRQVPSMEDFSSNTNDQTHMEVAKEVESSFKYTAAGHWEQGSKSVYYKDVAVISTTAGISCCEIGIPRVQPVFKQSTNEVTFVEAMLSHASECKNSLCLFPECHKMKAEIAHCLQHDLLRNYKKCDRCTSVGSVSIYHYRTCFVPSCSFFFCNILKARLNKQRTDDDLVCPHNIVYKDSIITFRIESFIENVHYSVITAKVVGHGQNGNVCEVELLQSIYENHARHIMQEQKICMKKCKYRAEEIEIVAAVRGHSNIIKTLLIVQSNDQMLVFMPKVKCSLLEWKNRLDNEKKNPSVLDVFDVANDVTHGLTFIHSHGIVHRDIKGEFISLE